MAAASFGNFCFCLLLISCSIPSIAAFANNLTQFRTFIRPLCYVADDSRQDKPFILGQETPLSQSFDNFLNLLEKIEIANPTFQLQDVLKLLLVNYTFENLKLKGAQYQQESLSGPQDFYLKNLWKADANMNVPEHNNPLSEDEICSLFFMLSHTVDNLPALYEDSSKWFSPVGKDGVPRAAETKHPRENGTVLIRKGSDAIALSRVVLGLYVGLTAEPKTLEQIVKDKQIDDDIKNERVSLLHIYSLIDTLVYNAWPSNEVEIGKFGNFRAIFNNGQSRFPDLICPTIYNLPEGATSMYTYSLLKGGADGLILGSIVKDIIGLSQHVKLSQILRSYYSPLGIDLHTKGSMQSDNGKTVVSYCNRKELIDSDTEIEKQIKLLINILIEDSDPNDKTEEKAFQFLNDHKSEIFAVTDGAVCLPPKSIEDLPCETPVELIIVLDTKSQRLDRQRELIGFLSNNLDLSEGGSSITILLDQQNSSSDLDLSVFQPRTYSAAEAACHLLQEDINEKGVASEIVIRGLNKFLSDRKTEDRDLTGAPGKLLLYFNFAEDEAINSALTQELKSFYRQHHDIRMFAVGENENLLKKFVGLNNKGFLRLVDGETEALALQLVQKICIGPAAFQYSDCKAAKDEARSVFEGYVSKGSVQHYSYEAKYFEKSFGAKVFFDTDVGNNIKVCHSRSSNSKSESFERNCKNTTSSDRRLEFGLKNPCKGMTTATCEPAYFSIIGSDLKPDEQVKVCTDGDCKSLHQSKFRVTHEGIRCSGSTDVFVSTFLISISMFLAYLMNGQ